MGIRTITMVIALAGALAPPAAAQVEDSVELSRTRGIAAGVFLDGSAVRAEGSALEAGPGVGVHLGFGFGDHVSLFARGSVAAVRYAAIRDESYSLRHWDVGVRYSFGGAGDALRPFAQAGGTLRDVHFDEAEIRMRGEGLTVGGGAEYFVARTVAIDAGLSITTGRFREMRVADGEWEEVEDGVSATSARLDVGISWHP